METKELMNVIVLGASGAGKSTLIKAISGTEVVTGVGEGNTQKIDLYESSTWPIRLIDTKGFEFDLIEQWKTIRQVKKFTKEQLAESIDENENGSGVDAVWYCVEGTSRRTFSHNIELMNKAIKVGKMFLYTQLLQNHIQKPIFRKTLRQFNKRLRNQRQSI